MFDDPELPPAPFNTLWIEENVKKLQHERDEYRARWETMREYLAKLRIADSSAWVTVRLIQRYMEELDTDPPTWQPTFVPDNLVIGEEETE